MDRAGLAFSRERESPLRSGLHGLLLLVGSVIFSVVATLRYSTRNSTKLLSIARRVDHIDEIYAENRRSAWTAMLMRAGDVDLDTI